MLIDFCINQFDRIQLNKTKKRVDKVRDLK